MACAFAGTALADGKQAAEAGIGGAVGGIGQDGRAVGEIQAAANDQAYVRLLRALMRTDDAGERIAVGDASAGKPSMAACANSSSMWEAPRRKE